MLRGGRALAAQWKFSTPGNCLNRESWVEAELAVMDEKNLQTFALGLLALTILGSDAWQDFRFFSQIKVSEPGLLVAAVTRTLLLVLTIVALFRPNRPLVVLAVITLLLALLRRALFLLPSINPELWPWVHSGLDLGFRVLVLAWAIDWLRKR